MSHKNKTNYSAYKERKKNQSNPLNKQEPLSGTHRKPDSIFTAEEANDRLYDIFKNHDFNLVSHDERKQLSKFYCLLMENQQKENFTRLLSIKDIAIKHFIDSLIILNYFKPLFPMLDLGTGPGLPGIPLKIKFPEQKILLAEGVQKRVTFLKNVREKMSLTQLEIIGKNIDTEFVYPVQSVITRAVEDIGNTMNNVMNCLVEGGQLIFMKGPNVDAELELAKKYSEFYKLESDSAYNIPKTPNKRRLVIYRKIKMPPLED